MFFTRQQRDFLAWAGTFVLIFGFILFALSTNFEGKITNLSSFEEGFGVMSLGLGFIAISEAFFARTLLNGIQRVEGNEKIAMLYAYCDASRGPLHPHYFRRMFADIRGVRAVQQTMTAEERIDLGVAVRELARILRENRHDLEANQVEATFDVPP